MLRITRHHGRDPPLNAYILEGVDGATSGAKCYHFRGATAARAWPMDAGINLGAAGAWNFLWRLGIAAASCRFDRLPAPSSSILFAAFDQPPSAEQAGALQAWIKAGGYVVASGDAKHCASSLGWDADAWHNIEPENPYAALAWVIDGRSPELIAPVRWRAAACRAVPAGSRALGRIACVQGERQTAARAALLPLADAPAVISGVGYCYLNGRPFAAFQAWLQGQADLAPWLGWRHRLCWLDEWVSAVAGIVSDVSPLAAVPHSGIGGLGATTVVLRHDLDHSRDTAYLEAESARGLPATHGVLDDANASFWVTTLEPHASHESALHYNTGGRDWFREARARLAGTSAPPLALRRSDIVGQGLHRQVKWAQSRGIGTASLLRHLSFQPYPEWIDALDFVFATEPGVLGGSSMFRAQTLRWGADRVDGVAGTIGDWPDAQYPFWLPFKLAIAADRGRMLRGWESASLMECEPQLVDQVLSHRIPRIPQRVITLGFHPAHARGTTFHRGGSLDAFLQVLVVIAAHGADVAAMRTVFASADAACRTAP